jgi:hypothetical protein
MVAVMGTVTATRRMGISIVRLILVLEDWKGKSDGERRR